MFERISIFLAESVRERMWQDGEFAKSPGFRRAVEIPTALLLSHLTNSPDLPGLEKVTGTGIDSANSLRSYIHQAQRIEASVKLEGMDRSVIKVEFRVYQKTSNRPITTVDIIITIATGEARYTSREL